MICVKLSLSQREGIPGMFNTSKELKKKKLLLYRVSWFFLLRALIQFQCQLKAPNIAPHTGHMICHNNHVNNYINFYCCRDIIIQEFNGGRETLVLLELCTKWQPIIVHENRIFIGEYDVCESLFVQWTLCLTLRVSLGICPGIS